MFVSLGQFTGASQRYKNVDLGSRIEGATPHQLIQLMYDELIKAIDAMAVAVRRGDYVQRGERQARALRILSGLETSLDFDKGGEIAASLATIYREARRLLAAAGAENDGEKVGQVRTMIGEIATAWTQIGLPKD
ncbi:flagellar export chaperone FliS [Sphingosinicella sp.]|uniref:flagellar export chaperone FliS n=1 Tax=Sphingosinicella sp. TaxID=1917971 RepID=UPI004037A5F5